MGLILSAAAPNVTAATSLAPLFTMPQVLFGGLFANSATMQPWLSWIQWVTQVRYANEAMNHAFLDDIDASPLPEAYLEE